MRKYLDDKFSAAARIAGNPYFILLNLAACVSMGILAQNVWVWLIVWLDVGISIWTLILDLIIVNQNNRINDHNAAQLAALVESLAAIKTLTDRQLVLEEQIFQMEADQGKKLDTIMEILDAKKD